MLHVCGPMSVSTRNGYRYFVIFTDDLSRYGYIYLMKHKSETFEKFKEFQSEVENQLNKKIKNLRSDRGGEYLIFQFGTHLKACGIVPSEFPPLLYVATQQLHRNRTWHVGSSSPPMAAGVGRSQWCPASICARLFLSSSGPILYGGWV